MDGYESVKKWRQFRSEGMKWKCVLSIMKAILKLKILKYQVAQKAKRNLAFKSVCNSLLNFHLRWVSDDLKHLKESVKSGGGSESKDNTYHFIYDGRCEYVRYFDHQGSTNLIVTPELTDSFDRQQ